MYFDDVVTPSSQASSDEEWASKRRQAASERARLMQQARHAEEAKAARVVKCFLEQARIEGLEPVDLVMRGYSGGKARTGLKGWYLRSDETVALGVDGMFYVLRDQLGWKERFFGATPLAEPVPMTIGEGGRDGDIVPLRFALNRLLPHWEERCHSPLT
ncbi:hypothetical protein [Actinomyces vulturis]|uniref:hypothetical protein n=1 Tax=Actinomyces vulturis TaxID=1857645 RepID=UPI00082AF362|nr:hypothetical protein [Actinomyces vulturis]